MFYDWQECDWAESEWYFTHSVRKPFILFLLKSVSKLFYKDGTGDPNILQVYMKNHDVENIPIVNIRGNRFNVLFYNAVGTFLCINIYCSIFILWKVLTLLFRILLFYACKTNILNSIESSGCYF